ncbi:hypothetical protein D3C76_1671590 [compost metagenome]
MVGYIHKQHRVAAVVTEIYGFAIGSDLGKLVGAATEAVVLVHCRIVLAVYANFDNVVVSVRIAFFRRVLIISLYERIHIRLFMIGFISTSIGIVLFTAQMRIPRR